MAKIYLLYKESKLPLILHALLAFLAYILWAILVFIIFPIFLVIQIFKLTSYFLALYFYDCKPLCLNDLPFMFHNDSNPYIIVNLMKIRGKLNINDFRKLFQERILDKESEITSIKKLKKYVDSMFNIYVWKTKNNFQIEDHIILYDKILTGQEEELKKIFIENTNTPLSLKFPLWKIQVCNTEEGKYTYIFFSFHHALGDGFSLLALLIKMFDKEPIFLKIGNSSGVMRDMYKRILHAVLTGPLVLATVLLSKWKDLPFYKKDSGKDCRKISWAKGGFEIVKELKNRTNTTVNDIFLALLSRALAKYFHSKTISELPIVISFNARSYKDLLNKNPDLGNNSGGTFLSLPLSKSPSETIKIIHRRTQILKSSSDGHTFEFIFSKILGLLPSYFGKLAAISLKEHCSLLVSNVAGPLETVVMNGMPIESIVSVPPLMYGLGVSISLFTYNNEVNIVVLSQKSILPDPEKLTSLFFDQITEFSTSLKEKID